MIKNYILGQGRGLETLKSGSIGLAPGQDLVTRRRRRSGQDENVVPALEVEGLETDPSPGPVDQGRGRSNGSQGRGRLKG